MAQWDTAFINNLPDSSFAYIEPGGQKDGDGKTTPRSKRHLPYKDGSGKLDLPHVRNALARLSQVQNMPAETKVRVRSMLENILAKNKSELRYSVLPALRSFHDATTQANLHWVQAFPYTTWDVGDGDEQFTRERAERMVKNFNDGVRVMGDADLCLDYDHKADPAKGGKAAGWIKSIEARDDGMYMGVELTPIALAEIENKEWKYISPSFFDDFEGTEDVFNGAGLTNQPVLKDIKPINFSELATIEKEVNEMTGTATLPAPVKDEKLEQEIRAALGIDENGDIISTIKNLSESAAKVKDLTDQANAAKALSEQFPDVAKRLAALEKNNIEASAREFSQGYARRGNKGFAPTALSEIVKIHKNLSEMGADAGALKTLLDDILDKGVVDFSERGSQGHDPNKSDATNPGDAAKQLSEKMQEFVVNGKAKDMDEALGLVVKDEPELWKMYQEGGGK